MKILFVVNEARFFLSHRLPLALEAQRRGWDVVVVTAPHTGEDRLLDCGFRHRTIPLSRSGFALGQEINSYRTLKQIYALEQPDLVHHVTIKPVIYGSFAARAAGVPAVVNAVPGMGFVFTRRGWRASIVRSFVNLLYRMAFAQDNMRVIFQNSEDLRGFLAHAIVKKAAAVLIRGSGVNLADYDPDVRPGGSVTFLMVARMLRDKGVYEYAKAAARAKETHGDWRFLLAGGVDTGNPTSLSEDELRDLEARYGIEWLGHCDEIPTLMASCHVVCLPTFYREGVPKALLEAAAAGRVMIASDVAGCREVVTDGVTGLLVPPRDVNALTDAMLRLGTDEALRERCARAAREKAEAVFSVHDVVEHTFRVYDELLTS